MDAQSDSPRSEGPRYRALLQAAVLVAEQAYAHIVDRGLSHGSAGTSRLIGELREAVLMLDKALDDFRWYVADLEVDGEAIVQLTRNQSELLWTLFSKLVFGDWAA